MNVDLSVPIQVSEFIHVQMKTSKASVNHVPPANPLSSTSAPAKKQKVKHDDMLRRLVLGGSLIIEAEQIIATRKTAFYTASRVFKKSALYVTNQKKQKKL
jgi:hypothetical protein